MSPAERQAASTCRQPHSALVSIAASGIPASKLVEAHGSFATASCTTCCRAAPGESFWVSGPLGGCVVGRRGVVPASGRRTRDGDSVLVLFSFQTVIAESTLTRVRATQRC